MQDRFSIVGALGIVAAVMFGLAIYTALDLMLEPNAVAHHTRPPKGAHQEVPISERAASP
jgi:hypothetical protein